MSLRRKTLLLISISLLGLIGVLSASLSIILLTGYTRLEERNVQRNLQRLKEALTEEVRDLERATEDWAAWNDTYQFASDRNLAYLRANLGGSTFANLRISFLLMFDRQNQKIWLQGLDPILNQPIPVPQNLTQVFQDGDLTSDFKNAEASVSGILQLPEEIYLISAQPILTSEGQGPSRGTLVMVRDLNDARLNELANLTRLEIVAYRPNAPTLPPSVRQALANLQTLEGAAEDNPADLAESFLDAPVIVQPLDRDVIAGYILLHDVYDQPALVLQVNLPREIYHQGLVSLRYLVLSLVGAGIAFGGLALVMLERMVLARLANLSRDVREIGADGDLSQRVQVDGHDELGSLAETINVMLTELEESAQALGVEQERTENLLLNILPKAIADRLKRDQQTIAESFAEVTVMFADIVGFTKLSAEMPPDELVQLLNNIFSRFDRLLEKYDLEKIKTIGDCYMVVGGLPVPRTDHAIAIVEMALDMQAELEHFNAETGQQFQMRVGINTGSVVAGVIGLKKFIYDLWGDAVNTASRMESHGIPNRIQVSSTTYECLKDYYKFEPRGMIQVKGKGDMMTYLLVGRNSTQPIAATSLKVNNLPPETLLQQIMALEEGKVG